MAKYQPMVPIQLGSTVQSISINRCNVAENTKGRAVLVDPQPRAVYLAFDNANRCSVLVDQEAVIKYHLNPRTYYVILVARLNTDMKGNQVDDDIVLEYLRMADNVYEKFADQFQENGGICNTILLKLEKKTADGKDFSYVVPTPSMQEASQGVKDRIAKISHNTEPLWALVQNSLGRTVEEYEKVLAAAAAENPTTDAERKKFAASASGTAQIAGPANGGAPALPASESNEFDDSGDQDEFES